jgi:hypothetical protein
LHSRIHVIFIFFSYLYSYRVQLLTWHLFTLGKQVRDVLEEKSTPTPTKKKQRNKQPPTWFMEFEDKLFQKIEASNRIHERLDAAAEDRNILIKNLLAKLPGVSANGKGKGEGEREGEGKGH